MTTDADLLFWSLVIAITGVAAVLDLRTGHIPNWLTLGGLLVALVAHATLGLRADGLVGAVGGVLGPMLGLAATALVPLLLYRTGGVGGGDVKLLAAVGALSGVTLGVEVELYAFTVAAVYLGARMALRGELFRVLRRAIGDLPALVSWRHTGRRARCGSFGELRFAPSVFVASCVVAVSQFGEVQ